MINIGKEMESKGDWFFGMWQPEFTVIDGVKTPFEDAPSEYLVESQKPWILSAENDWHGFKNIEPDYAMLDPIKLTITTAGFTLKGDIPEFGIPANIVANFLRSRGIVCEKADYYSFLMLNSLGTNRAKQESLMMELMRFKRLYDANAPMNKVFPELVAKYPEYYASLGLREHCQTMHNFIRQNKMLAKMQNAFEVVADQIMTPAQAYREVVKKNVEFVPLAKLMNRIPAVMIVPYPPGVPIMMGGEIINKRAKPIFDYLVLREKFENKFAGYESEINGIERFEKDDKKYFKILCIKN